MFLVLNKCHLSFSLFLRHIVMGDYFNGHSGRQHTKSQSRALLRSYQLPTVRLEWQRWLPQSLEQPSVLQRPLVFGDR